MIGGRLLIFFKRHWSKSGTIRKIDSTHRLSKLRAYSAIDFDRAK
ncbi:hypothetical protein [Streptomyces sp. NPDC059651]